MTESNAGIRVLSVVLIEEKLCDRGWMNHNVERSVLTARTQARLKPCSHATFKVAPHCISSHTRLGGLARHRITRSLRQEST
jgi:hypothetical protein